MMRVEPRFRLTFTLQCALAAGVFCVFFLAQSFAYLLYLYPRSEWLWFLSVRLNREARPMLELFDRAFPLTPVASCAVLAVFCLVPLLFCFRRSWLGISAFGHIALLVALLPVNIAIQQAGGGAVSYASLADVADFAARNTSTGFWLLTAAALLPLCILNHVAFFRGLRRRVSG
jgi:hypothetical protein